jgi:hypothetical protein
LDKTGGVAGTTSAQVATQTAVDALSGGELHIGVAAAFYSAAATKTLSLSAAADATGAVLGNNQATSTVSHYVFVYGITAVNTSAASVSFTFTTTSITGAAVASATFLSRPSSVLPNRAARRHLLNR